MDNLTSLFLLAWLVPAVLFTPATVLAYCCLRQDEPFFLVRMHPMTFLRGATSNLGLWLAVACCPVVNLLMAPVFVSLFLQRARTQSVGANAV